MRSHWLCGIMCGILSAASCFGGLLDNIFGAQYPDVITVTDTTEEGRKWPQPEPGKPVYYEAIVFGAKNFHGLPGDREPTKRAMSNLIVGALKKQGYLIGTQKGQATIFLSISWGYRRATLGSLAFLGGDKLDLMWELHPEFSSVFAFNALHRNMRSSEASAVMEAANSDLYIVSIRAFDLKAIDADKEVELWHTKIALPANGSYMEEAIPTMITLATPFIGRETKKPMFSDQTPLRTGHVEIGPTKTLEFVDPEAGSTSATPPTKSTDSTSSDPKATPAPDAKSGPAAQSH